MVVMLSNMLEIYPRVCPTADGPAKPKNAADKVYNVHIYPPVLIKNLRLHLRLCL